MNAASSNPAPRRPGDQTVLAPIGNTPLVPLDALLPDLPAVQLLGKAEWYNPGGSVKDRAAANIVSEARRSGKLAPGRRILQAYGANIIYIGLGKAPTIKIGQPAKCPEG